MKFKKVTKIAEALNITVETLDRAFRNYEFPPPKLILQWFRCYYAAYLLKFAKNFSLQIVADHCRYSCKQELYKQFKTLTHLNPGDFQNFYKFQDFPSLCLNEFKIKSKNAYDVKK